MKEILQRLEVHKIWSVKNETIKNLPGSSKLEKVKKAAEKLVKTSSVFGLPRVFQTESIYMKILWLLMIFISGFFGLYVIGKNLADFFKYDKVTVINQVYPESIIFPSITLCDNSNNPNISNRIISLEFKGKKLNDSESDAELFKLDEEFDCLRINGSKLEMNLNDSLKQSLVLRFNSSINDSLLMFINDNYENSFISTHPVLIEPKRYNLVLITKTVDKKLSEPYTTCSNNLDKSYRQTNCIEKCTENRIAMEYNCSIFGYYHSIDTFCTYVKGNLYFGQFKGVCLPECPLECDSTRYDNTISSSHLIHTNDLETIISVRLTSLSYKEIFQVPRVDFFSLVSSV